MVRIGQLVGDEISRQVCRHHTRRLEKIGSDALDPPAGGWAKDAPPPRDGNAIEVLIDGEIALARMAEEIRAATSHVHLTGWFISPDFVLEAGPPAVVARDLLAETARRIDVRVLLWAGAPLPVFRPSRKLVRKVRDELRAAGVGPLRARRQRTAASLPPREDDHRSTIASRLSAASTDRPWPGTGATPRAPGSGRRWAGTTRPSGFAGRSSPMSPTTSPALARRDRRAAGMRRRTLSARPARRPRSSCARAPSASIRRCPAETFGVLESYLRALRSAEHLIYLESQYPVVAGDRDRAGRQAPQAAERPFPGR